MSTKVTELKKTPEILNLAPGEIVLKYLCFSQPIITTGSCSVVLGGSFVSGTGQGSGIVEQLVLQLNGQVRCTYAYEAPGAGKVYRRTWFNEWAHAVE